MEMSSKPIQSQKKRKPSQSPATTAASKQLKDATGSLEPPPAPDYNALKREFDKGRML
jgi:hypothetical protein